MPGKQEHTVPARVEGIADAIRRDDLGMPDSTAHRIAWKTYRKETGTKRKGKKQPLTGYKEKKAMKKYAQKVKEMARQIMGPQETVASAMKKTKGQPGKQQSVLKQLRKAGELTPEVAQGFVEKCAAMGITEEAQMEQLLKQALTKREKRRTTDKETNKVWARNLKRRLEKKGEVTQDETRRTVEQYVDGFAIRCAQQGVRNPHQVNNLLKTAAASGDTVAQRVLELLG